MARNPKNQRIRLLMCKRLSAALDESQLSDTQLSKLMGYTTSATLSSMRRGESFLDAEKLAVLAGVRFRGIAHVNLHWVLTGDGPAFLAATSTKADHQSVKAMNQLVQGANLAAE